MSATIPHKAIAIGTRAVERPRGRSSARGPATTDPAWLRFTALFLALGFLGVVMVFPVGVVFVSALADGWRAYLAAFSDPDALAAIRLTLLVAAIAVPLNLVFGIAAAWLLSKYRFPGRNLLVTLVDLPFSVSPVIAGLALVLVFGVNGWVGSFLAEQGIQLLFAVPGVVLATVFVTLPLVAREVLAVMEATGSDQEEAALVLGASGLQILWRITLPRVRWGLLYGVILCNARAMGEFGAVSVVSGHVRGLTNTMPLHVEILYNEYSFVSAFAVASLLAGLALCTLLVKKLANLDWSWTASGRLRSGKLRALRFDGQQARTEVSAVLPAE